MFKSFMIYLECHCIDSEYIIARIQQNNIIIIKNQLHTTRREHNSNLNIKLNAAKFAIFLYQTFYLHIIKTIRNNFFIWIHSRKKMSSSTH